jgi:hypothetical protein
MASLPPLKAIGKVKVEIYGALPGSAKWDEAIWGQSTWSAFGWMDVTPQSMVARVSWGADDPTGVLTIPAAGAWVINTYDPQRLLDPSNGRSPYATSMRPGKPLRVSYIDATSTRRIVRQGLIDEIDFDIMEKRGTLRGTDMVQLMVNAVLPAAQVGLPSTLRARATELIKRAGLSLLVPVEGAPDVALNGSFESVDDPTSPYPFPHNWIPYPDGAYTFAPLLEEVDGARAIWLGLYGTSHSIFQAHTLVPGRTYTLSASAKRDSGSVSNGSVQIQDVDNSFILAAELQFTNGHPFVRKSVTFVAPAPAGRIQINIAVAANPAGEGWYYDDITLTEELIDAPVGPALTVEASVWTHILTASLDALYAAWLDRAGTLRFRSFGNPQDTGFQAGGAEGIPISTLKTQGSLQGVYTHVIAFDDGAPTVPVEATDATKKSLYGDIVLKRDQPVPDAAVWVASVLADRSGASLQYEPGTLYPQTEEMLESILNLGMIDIAHLVAESVDPSVDVAARVLGGVIVADTGTGWTAQLSTYVPATEWDEAEQPEPPPIEPPPNVITGVVRTYACTKDSRLAHSSSLDAGNGLDVNLPIGNIGAYRNRAVMGFASIPFAGVVSVDKAELLVTIGSNSCGAFGSDPKVNVSRLTGGFSEGTYNVNCGFGTGNAVKYPGPSTTSSGAVTKAVSKTTGTQVAIDITAIVKAWHSGQSQHGLMVKSAGEDTAKYTTAFYARHHGTAGNRPSLRLTLTVEA